MIRPVLIVYHVWKGSPYWERWFQEQTLRLARAEIPSALAISPAPCENVTINRLRDSVEQMSDGAVLYLHQKAITRGEESVHDWREMMEYFCIDRWPEALERLEGQDAVGCDLVPIRGYGPESEHFSGNFWWAQVAYLKMLERIAPDAPHNTAEGWIGTGKGRRLASLHQSGVDHYSERYPPERYR